MPVLAAIRERAAKRNCRIVFPESSDERVIRAAEWLSREEVCRVVLLGREETIRGEAESKSIRLDDGIQLLDPETCEETGELAEHLYERRREKGLSREDSGVQIRDPLYFGGAMVGTGRADACVAGSISTTGEVIRAALHTIGLREGNSLVSSIFLMELNNGKVLTYADCGVVPYPDAEQLSEIAVESARTHRILAGEEPRVAMLSFSTLGSAAHERVDLVREALERAKSKEPGLKIDGEFQFDAAYVPEVAKRKAPGSEIAGRANVFIFPNLDAGNIAYKITERIGGAGATGPILQGLDKPVMDLSRGCDWEDIVNAACVAAVLK